MQKQHMVTTMVRMQESKNINTTTSFIISDLVSENYPVPEIGHLETPQRDNNEMF